MDVGDSAASEEYLRHIVGETSGKEGNGLLFPMDQVRTRRMTPGQVTPLNSRGVILKEEVVYSVVVY